MNFDSKIWDLYITDSYQYCVDEQKTESQESIMSPKTCNLRLKITNTIIKNYQINKKDITFGSIRF
ncbi:hypothetical protein CMK18_12315 [Candidatus Poribacteria bacterium]|nr:hypothetical protein [Candidatus Poribacteria bacterium]